MTAHLAEEVFREASESIDVLSPPVDDVRRRAREQRRRQWSVVAGSVVVVALAVGAVTWSATRPVETDTSLTSAPTARAENPADVVWFANGELHLDHVVVELPPVRELVAISGGAVYAADDGAVVFVADDGARTQLGNKGVGTPLVASEEQGWVSWSDTTQPESVLVLYDLTSRQRLRTVAPPDPDHGLTAVLLPVAIDQDRLYYRAGGESYAVTPDGAPEPLDSGLLDVASATRVFQSHPGLIRMEQSFFGTVTTAVGVGARVSPDGDVVLTRTPDDRSAYGAVRLYDARTGDGLISSVTGVDVAIAAAFGPDGTVSYIVARAEDGPSIDGFVQQSFSGELELRTCSLATGACTVDAKFPSTGSVPLLAD